MSGFPSNMILFNVSWTRVGSEGYQQNRNVANHNTFTPYVASKTYIKVA